ncbi:MAG: hypothetical protein HY927_10000 [Elusimicrobia bacterium]|nr:hypothetical protein [Elusimicrobiota bacterium]
MALKKNGKDVTKKEASDLARLGKGAGKVALIASVAALAGIAIAKALKKRSDKNSVQRLVEKIKTL